VVALACVLGDGGDMPFPNAAGKHAGHPCVTAHQLLAYRAVQGRAADPPPAVVVLGWQGILLANCGPAAPSGRLAARPESCLS